jgi:prepilin-type N-terminal cleavage/methylation domain-containing protein
MNTARSKSHAFTLIEIMVVVAIMGIILTMGIPSIVKAIKREGMRKAVNDVVEVCSHARARAILSGTETQVIFHPRERRLEVSGGGGTPKYPDGAPETITSTPAGSGLSAQLPDEITIEMLDINLLEYGESDVARVRFYPNGTSDEMTLILHSLKGNQNDAWRKIWLEVTTGLADWGPVK